MIEPLGFKDFDEAISEIELRGMRLLAFAMAISPMIYLIVAYFVAWEAPAPSEAPAQFLVMVTGTIATILFVCSTWFANWSLRRKDLAKMLEQGIRLPKGAGTITGRHEIVAYLLRVHTLLRLALVEGMAVLGLFLAFLASGLLREEPLWLLVLVPCPLATLTVFLTFPTKERLQAVFERTLQGRP